METDSCCPSDDVCDGLRHISSAKKGDDAATLKGAVRNRESLLSMVGYLFCGPV